MLKKIMLSFILVWVVLLAYPALAEMSSCNNLTFTDKNATSADAMQTNDSRNFFIVDSSDDQLYTYNSTGANISGINLGALGLTTVRGVAINKSREFVDFFWLYDQGDDRIFKLNTAGTIVQNASITGITLTDPRNLYTLDGTRFWISDKDLISIIELNSNFSFVTSCDLSNRINGAADDFIVLDKGNGKVEFWVWVNTPKQLVRVDNECNLVRSYNSPFLTSLSTPAIASYDNRSLYIYDDSNSIMYNFTNDTIAPSVIGPRLNSTRFLSGDTINITFDVTDNCAPGVAATTINETGRFRNYTTDPYNFTLDWRTITSTTYTIQYSNISACSRDIGFQVVVNDTGGNSNITNINFTTAYPLMQNFQLNSTEPWNCTATNSQNFTYTFVPTSWYNFSINLSAVVVGANVTCPYISTAELTNITTNTSLNACKVHALNRVNPGNVVTFSLYTALTAGGVSNLPAAVAVATIASIIVAIAVARSRRN